MFRRGVIALSLLVLAFPIAVAAETRVDLDREKDFSRYKSFTLQIDAPIRADGVVDEQNTLAENRLRQAVARELQTRGLEATEAGADLTVRVSSRGAERTVIVDSGWNGYPWAWGRRRYWRGPYWGPYASDLWTRRYLEGSVTVDIIERDSGELVYRAQVIDEIGNNRDKQVIKTIDKAFKKFPVKEISAE